MSNLKKVTEQEFDDFINNYPAKKLRRNVVRICEPASSNFLDDSIHSDHEVGSMDFYYDKVVARICHEWKNGEETDAGSKFWEYSILSE